MPLTAQYETPESLEHLWKYLEETDVGCWRWTGDTDARGYPKVGVHEKGVRPHRKRHVRSVMYELATGSDNSERNHILKNACGNRWCVRYHPDHLYAQETEKNIIARKR